MPHDKNYTKDSACCSTDNRKLLEEEKALQLVKAKMYEIQVV